MASGGVLVVGAAGMAAPVRSAVVNAPRVRIVDAPERVRRFERFEVTATIAPEPANPFDPAEIDARVVFGAPDGSEHPVIAFYYQGYRRSLVGGTERLEPQGRPIWKARFAPPVTGRWMWRWEVRTPAGIAVTDPRVVRVIPGKDRGYVRRSKTDPRFLAFDDGSSFFAVGENVAWYTDEGTFAYDRWYRRLARQGANYARLWMPSFAFGIEWSDTGLGDYRKRLDRAWQLDRVIETGERYGIYQMVSLLNHGAFSTVFNAAWADNPYNAANGGPLTSPPQFFTDPEAARLFRQLLRYVVARWGYSTHVLAWELWNEVDLTDGFQRDVVAQWHRAMAAELRRLDPADHLVSTSLAIPAGDASFWRDAGLDFSQVHLYANAALDGSVLRLFDNMAGRINQVLGERRATSDLPFIVGEFGVDARGPNETRDDDPDAIGFHDGLWAGAVSGSFGTAMSWWWDNVVDRDPDRYYPLIGAVARFTRGVAWDREGFEPLNAAVAVSNRPLAVYGLRGTSTVLVWVKDPAYQWDATRRVAVQHAAFSLDAGPGAWCGEWWDTWKGKAIDPVKLNGANGPRTVTAPRFTGDIALRLAPC